MSNYDSILLENMQSQLKAVAEGLLVFRQVLEEKIDCLRTELKVEISDLRLGLSSRMDRLDARFDRMDTRFDGVDDRLDRIDARLERYGGDIDVLKKASISQ